MSNSDKEPNYGKRLTPLEWDQVVDLYEGGECNQPELARRFGISPTAISKGLSKRGAVRGARKPSIADENRKIREEERKRELQEIKDVKKRHRKYNDMLAQIAMGKIAKAAGSGENYAAHMEDLKSIRIAQNIVNKIRDDNFHLLGLYKDDTELEDIDELNIGVLSDKETREIRDLGEDQDLLEVFKDEIEKLEKGEDFI